MASRVASRRSRGHALVHDLADAVPVGDDDAVEAPLALEHVAQQMAVRVHRGAVDVVERRHHRQHAARRRRPGTAAGAGCAGCSRRRTRCRSRGRRRRGRSRRSAWRTRRCGRAPTGPGPGSPRTAATASRPASTGASPKDSATRPQRGSSERSTIGAKVQAMPSTTASAAAMVATSRTRSGSNDAASPSGIGYDGPVAVDHVATEQHRDAESAPVDARSLDVVDHRRPHARVALVAGGGARGVQAGADPARPQVARRPCRGRCWRPGGSARPSRRGSSRRAARRRAARRAGQRRARDVRGQPSEGLHDQVGRRRRARRSGRRPGPRRRGGGAGW